jgi:hypothetical protein
MKPPTLIQEAIAGSHIDVWNAPVFSKWGMFFFTLMFGSFGLHYVMLRAPILAVLFIIVNSLTMGYWWYYDLIQLAFTSVDDLNLHGLGSPFLFQYAVAVGMWTGGSDKVGATAKSKVQRGGDGSTVKGAGPAAPTDNPKSEDLARGLSGFFKQLLTMLLGTLTQPNPRLPLRPLTLNSRVIENPFGHSIWIFLFLLFLPIGPVSSAIAGDMWGAFLHCIDPLMFLTFFFNAVQVTVNPLNIFVQGMSRPIFWTKLLNIGSHDFGRCTPEFQMILTQEELTHKPANEIETVILPMVNIAEKAGIMLQEVANLIPAAGVPKVAGAMMKTADAAAEAAEGQAKKAAAEARLIDAQAAAIEAKAALAKGATTAGAETNTPKAGGNDQMPIQRGGFVQRSHSPPQPTDSLSLGVIGAVLAGGLLLGASRTALNVLQGKDDSPPNARRV